MTWIQFCCLIKFLLLAKLSSQLEEGGLYSLLAIDRPDCTRTRNGCTCQFSWKYGSEDYNGCSNPDGDSQGLWCNVDLDSCEAYQRSIVESQQVQSMYSEEVIGYWDRCFSECEEGSGFPESKDQCRQGNQTMSGCSCLKDWSHIVDGSIQSFQYCSNPDNSIEGNWCKIDNSRPCDLIKLTESNGQVKNAEFVGLWDYCIPACGGQHSILPMAKSSQGFIGTDESFYYDTGSLAIEIPNQRS
eukprot:TRINITY_DN72864_c0_g1_i6.p2 TRINITY_DN72864_c0_g1~~TRINITY_DN72864_c0_g1_i6.p2  ORF type:complete len:243 (-),score=8.65 TRINITY_DN72864_c0_g1_i6:526-1254(-)